uniref:Uncharacterized protein n=1 Tax=Anabas testudineus TaxID=64144 RepID=A0A3Q1IAX9_ANATE
ITFTRICKVPDLGGFPPSIAVRVSSITVCFSRSNAFCSTNSGYSTWPLNLKSTLPYWDKAPPDLPSR